jgi:hypothetical protein
LSKEAPFLIAALLAALGWMLAHVVDRVTEAPTIVYRVCEGDKCSKSEGQKSSRKYMSLEVQNISSKMVFSNIKVVFAIEPTGRIKNFLVRPVEPSHEGDEPWILEQQTASFEIPKIHPGGIFEFELEYEGKNPPSLRFISESQAVRWIKPGLQSWYVNRETEIFIALSGLFLIAILIFEFMRKP